MIAFVLHIRPTFGEQDARYIVDTVIRRLEDQKRMIALDLGELMETAGRKPTPVSYRFVEIGTEDALPAQRFVSWLVLGDQIDHLTSIHTSDGRSWAIEIEMSDGTTRRVEVPAK